MNKFRLLVSGRLAARAFMRRAWKSPAIRTTGNFTVGVLPRHPHFDVIGLPCAESHIARAQNDRTERQFQPLQNRFRAFGHAFMFGLRLVGRSNTDQFDLIELMLAQHTTRIFARSACSAKTRRARGNATQRQLSRSTIALLTIGQRNFRRRHQPQIFLGRRARQSVGPHRQD